MPESVTTIQTNSDTQTNVLGFKIYSRTPEIVQGGIKNVTGTYQAEAARDEPPRIEASEVDGPSGHYNAICL